MTLAVGCQHDSTASFDDSRLGETDHGGSMGSAGGAEAGAGESSGGSEVGGDTPVAGKNSGGAAGSVSGAGGAAGSPSSGGKGGASGATSGGHGGTAGDGGGSTGGKAGADVGGNAGTAGSMNPPALVTWETRDIDDAGIASCRLLQNFGAEPSLTVDASGGGQGFCIYRGLFAVPLGALPKAAEIKEATLTLACLNAGAAVTISYVEQPWAELSVTWASSPLLGAKIGTVTCETPGKVSLDLTAAARAWLAGEHASYGVYLTTDGDNGTDFATSEAKAEGERPLLSVTYQPPAL